MRSSLLVPSDSRESRARLREVQRVLVSTSAQGTFNLSLTYGGSTYKTAELAFGATAAQVQTALNAALTGVGTAAVSLDSASAYLVTFGGALAGKELPDVKVGVNLAAVAPTGSFTIEYKGVQSGAISYSATTATMAANLQAALEAMSGIGAGNVSVSYDAANSDTTHANYLVRFKGTLAGQNVEDFTTHFAALNLATAKPFELTAGAAAVAEERCRVGNNGSVAWRWPRNTGAPC